MWQIIGVFVIAVSANVVGTILIKIGSEKMLPISFSLGSILNILQNFHILGGIFLYAASFPAYSFILQKLNINVAYPVFVSLSFAGVIVVSSLFLKETLTFVQIIGLILVVGGIALLATGTK